MVILLKPSNENLRENLINPEVAPCYLRLVSGCMVRTTLPTP